MQSFSGFGSRSKFPNQISQTSLKISSEDFLGKVKNKAGDVEKILKEKDKHGKVAIIQFSLSSDFAKLYSFE